MGEQKDGRHVTATGYGKDLAYIHGDGFSGPAYQAAEALPRLFSKFRIPDKDIFELGCGGGQLARSLMQNGYTVTGIDASSAMITLARRHARGGRFRVASLWDVAIPTVAGVIAVGEVLNYQFDGRVTSGKTRRLFKRIHRALRPSGIFIFDVLCETRLRKPVTTFSFREGRGWLVAVEKTDSSLQVIRRIHTFRRFGHAYARSHEVHRVHRYNPREIRSALRAAGFDVTLLQGYGRFRFEPYHLVFVAQKKRSGQLHRGPVHQY